MRNLKAILEYDGTFFKGFQIQPQARTVQGVLEEALFKLTGEKIRVIGAGRTDAGVHALGQVINFFTDSTIPASRFVYALNSYLPQDIRVLEVKEVDMSFHARYAARWKTYRYLIRTEAQGKVFWRNYALIIPDALDLPAMQKAGQYLLGTHDFRAFCASGSQVENYKRSLYKCSLWQRKFGLILEVTADGFLYHMMRNIVGTLLQVGRNQRLPEELLEILASLDRAQAGPTAPPQGLYLVEIGY